MLVVRSWITTLVSAVVAVTLALVGLASTTLYPGVTPLLSTGLLAGSLASTGVAFATLVLRVRRLEAENEGLIEEISQEFDRVKDTLDIYGEALAAPRSLAPEEDAEVDALRRVVVK